MRRLVASAIVAVGALALVSSAHAVPSFTRQTGMTCAQCHVMFGAPVPNFTFTGKKFRMNGYRVPFVTERIEAGQEGALGGKRLNISLFPYLSLRYQSVFAAQSKAPVAGAKASPISSNPTSRLAIFTGGPVADNFGLWTEMYLTPDGSAGNNEWTLGLFSLDEYDLRYTRMKKNNVFGLAFSNQGISEIAGFGPWPISVPQEFNRGSFFGWSHPNTGNLLAYAFLNDKILVTGGASPGQSNLDWKRLNYLGQLAYAIYHSDARELWVNVIYKAGNDDIPFVSNTAPGANRTWTYTSNVQGIDATRAVPGPYVAVDMLKTSRLTTEVRYSFIDRGPHSAEVVGRMNLNHDTFRDNAEAKRNDLGTAVRYVYNRTYGVDFGVWKPMTFDFTSRTGVKTAIKTKPAYQSYFTFQPAMNMILSLAVANLQSQNLTTTPVTGWNWSLGVDFLF